jgi:hypothetical protein
MRQGDLWTSDCAHGRGWWVAHFGDTVRITCAVCGYEEEMREQAYIKRFSKWQPPTAAGGQSNGDGTGE